MPVPEKATLLPATATPEWTVLGAQEEEAAQESKAVLMEQTSTSSATVPSFRCAPPHEW